MVYRGYLELLGFCSFTNLSVTILGYIDDLHNTDNAWVEAEVWNFHYGSSISFPNLRTDVCFKFVSKCILYIFKIDSNRVRHYGKMSQIIQEAFLFKVQSYVKYVDVMMLILSEPRATIITIHLM